jgi:hypothetical protein
MLAKMRHEFSLTPGFSPVQKSGKVKNRFNGFPRASKPLKRLALRTTCYTGLKPGVNEIDRNTIHFC